MLIKRKCQALRKQGTLGYLPAPGQRGCPTWIPMAEADAMPITTATLHRMHSGATISLADSETLRTSKQ